VATSIRVLVHDANKSLSLFSQLEIEDTPLLSRAKTTKPKNNLPQFPLCILRLQSASSTGLLNSSFNQDGTINEECYKSVLDSHNNRNAGLEPYSGVDTRFLPRFSNSPENTFVWIQFQNWWSQPILLEPSRRGRERSVMTRRQLILNMANKDGGAHVDPRLSGTYGEITNHLFLAVSFGGTRTGQIGAPHQASVVQVGYELFRTVKS
jgi:hypothetical protein